MYFSQFKNFEDFCYKNDFTTEQGLKILLEEYKKLEREGKTYDRQTL